MFIIYGRRSYGRVEACGNEFAKTKFVHIYFMPLIPTETIWFTSESTGFQTRLNWKSVGATYLRWWSLPLALGAVATTPPFVGLPVAAALIALYALSWTWASVRGTHELRRRDFNRLAFGTRCDPSAMDGAMLVRVGAAVKERWQKLDAGRSPDDVARFGAKNPGEAVVAYGMLRLAAIERNGRAEADAAERILLGAHEAMPADQGPYRDVAREPADEVPPVADIHARVAAAATTTDATRRAGLPQLTFLQRHGRLLAAFAFIGAVAGVGAAVSSFDGLRGPQDIAITDLQGRFDDGTLVRVECDRVRLNSDLTDHRYIVTCGQGETSVAVIAQTPSPGNTIEGRLRRIGGNQYVIEATPAHARCTAIGGIVAALVGLGGGILLIRRSRRR